MPERVHVFNLDTGEATETFAIDAVEIVKSDPTRFAYKLPAGWTPRGTPGPNAATVPAPSEAADEDGAGEDEDGEDAAVDPYAGKHPEKPAQPAGRKPRKPRKPAQPEA